MSRLILLNKPFRVMSQFSPNADKQTLADFISMPGVYPAGRLDYDSEGLLLLTDDGALQHHISHPDHKLPKTYWVQVEGLADKAAITQLKQGVTLNDGPTKAAQVTTILEPTLWARQPPVRFRQSIPTSWLEITISEGRNRQVRRMTAAVGLPTLRLIRVAIGPWQLADLQPGQWREETALPVIADRRQSRTVSRAISRPTSRPALRPTNQKPNRRV